MRLGTLFSDGAVLQQGLPAAVWGETLPGLLVKAEIEGKQAFARASADGGFLLHLPPLAVGGPFELKVFSPENEAETVTVHDVMVGEVWLCSGQSNMQYKLNAAAPEDNDESAPKSVARQQEEEFIKLLDETEKFRFITVPLKVTGCQEKYFTGQWKHMTAENAPVASAVGAWFGSELRNRLKVPVGLICCSWGGSIAETWISPAALRTNPDTRALIDEWEALRREPQAWDVKEIAAGPKFEYRPDPGNTGFGQGWADPAFDDSPWKTMRVPGSWIGQKIAGNGVIWARKTVELPPEMAGKDLILKTGGIDKQDITYFNNVEIGRTGKEDDTQYFDQPREYCIPGKLVKAGRNVIAIRAFSFVFDGSLGGSSKAYLLTDGTHEIPLAGDWKARAEFDWGISSVAQRIGLANHNTAGLQFGSMVNPLLPFAFRGVIWYQGESNAKSLEDSARYQRLMETMIRDWRFRFEQPDLPFFQVQLADFGPQDDYDEFSAWAVLREAQRRVCQTLPGVYLITALDAGDEKNIHPQDKKSVGFRLAAAALYQVYHQDVLPYGPVFWKVKPEEGGALRVFFHFAEGLELRDAPGNSFYLAGGDGRYFPADRAEICGDSIVLSSRQVRNPVNVRYAWSKNPNSILYNKQYPAASFSSEK